jgi:hypothetical protein
LIFQAMDAAGKDGAIKHVMSGVNPQGCQVFSFKHPSALELDHDFLWRTTRCLPERGRIGIFNRSYWVDGGREERGGRWGGGARRPGAGGAYPPAPRAANCVTTQGRADSRHPGGGATRSR